MSQRRNIGAIILAAGFSSRMGSFKPLLPLAGSTVIEKSVSVFRSMGIQEITVVVGHRAKELLPVLSRMGVNIIYNRDYASGMFSSVKAGVSSIKASVEAFFLLPGDIPLVRPATVARLVDVYLNCPSGIIYPCFKGERGHPPLISAGYQAAILAWEKDGGLRTLLEEFAAEARDVEVTDQGVLLDMDTPGDYQKIRETLPRDTIPSIKDCLALLKNAAVPASVTQHCQAVAKVAKKIAQSLGDAGYRLDTDLILAAALLHDIAREKREHAQVGAQHLRELGYPRVAEIVASHMDLPLLEEEIINEASVVYLADKLVKEDRLVLLEQRFQEICQKYSSEEAAFNAAIGRLNQAKRIQLAIERVIELPLEKIIGQGKGYQDGTKNDLLNQTWCSGV
ncbi:DVU_1551 family NTP transferase [Desulforamulus aeronauticus]|uniref:HDIG domain-containing protein n=1 Tax=Desulforamulus aeronauticus DSM 10349 TaxID=1121421 RepID=A0A1M6S139_9FIRM|nr:NTP transferase domain-containing protein [Desulforamulus aeronauticus]SHK38461.1 HDIG domain-containing protein [Desulforamulus aeronauticus DSM 10349]